MVDAVRGLCLGIATANQIYAALAWSVALVAVFAPIAAARFRRTLASVLAVQVVTLLLLWLLQRHFAP